MKVVRAHNPAETLLLINPNNRRKSMTRTAVKKKTNRGGRRSPNRSRNSTTALVRRPTQFVANRSKNRSRNSRRANRRSNPALKSLIMGGLWAGAGAAITNVIAGLIPFRGDGWMGIVKGIGAAWLTGFIAEKVVSPADAQLMAIGGFAGTAWGAINMVLAGGGNILASFAPAPAANLTPTAAAQPSGGVSGFYDIAPYPYDYDGMGDLVEAPEEYADAAWPYPLAA